MPEMQRNVGILANRYTVSQTRRPLHEDFKSHNKGHVFSIP